MTRSYASQHEYQHNYQTITSNFWISKIQQLCLKVPFPENTAPQPSVIFALPAWSVLARLPFIVLQSNNAKHW